MYQPSITDEQVRKLYQLKQIKKRPMTKLIQEAVEQYLITKEKENNGDSNMDSHGTAKSEKSDISKLTINTK